MDSKLITIHERSKYGLVLNTFFKDNTVFLKTRIGNIETEFISFEKGLALFKIPPLKTRPDHCYFISRHRNNLVTAIMNIVKQTSENLYYFLPVKVQLIVLERKDERTVVNNNEKQLVFAKNILTDNLIADNLVKKRDTLHIIRELIQYDFRDPREVMKIFFLTDKNKDWRMEYFRDGNKPVLINDVYNYTVNQSEAGEKNYYEHLIGSGKKKPQKKRVLSEIAVPVLYKKMIPYGYLQLNSNKLLPKSKIAVMVRFADKINAIGDERRLLSELSSMILVSDVSRNGLGIVFSNIQQVPVYQEKNNARLDLLLPGGKIVPILAAIRHIDLLKNKVVKVGFQIKTIDNNSSGYYEKYLNKLAAS